MTLDELISNVQTSLAGGVSTYVSQKVANEVGSESAQQTPKPDRLPVSTALDQYRAFVPFALAGLALLIVYKLTK